MVKSIQYFMYCFSCAFALGVFNLPGRLPDLLFLVLISFVSIDIFKKSGLGVRKEDLTVIYVMLTFMVYFSAIILVRSRAANIRDYVNDQRLVFPFFLFFAGLYSIDTGKRLKSFIVFIIICSLVGAVMSVAQAMNGKEPIIDSDFYALGHAQDQLKASAGLASRTMLPVLNLVEPIFLVYIVSFFITRRKMLISYALFLLPAVIFGYARSHWLAIIASAIIGYFVVVLANSTNKRKSLYRAISYLLLAAFVIAILIVLLDPILSISDRFYSAYSDVTRFSGNFRARVFSSSIALAVWLRAPIFGQSPDFMWRTGWFALSDVGVTYTLVTIGLLGLVLFLIVLFVLTQYGYRTFRRGTQEGKMMISALGMGLFVTPIFMFLMLQTTQNSCLLSVLSIFALIVVRFNNAEFVELPNANPTIN